MISKGWNCFAVNCQKNLIQLYDRVTIFFLFVTVNVISLLPRCYSRLAPFCFMKNNNTHACIVSALSGSWEYLSTQYDCINAPNYTKNPVVFSHAVFSIQHGDIVNAFELESLGQILIQCSHVDRMNVQYSHEDRTNVQISHVDRTNVQCSHVDRTNVQYSHVDRANVQCSHVD